MSYSNYWEDTMSDRVTEVLPVADSDLLHNDPIAIPPIPDIAFDCTTLRVYSAPSKQYTVTWVVYNRHYNGNLGIISSWRALFRDLKSVSVLVRHIERLAPLKSILVISPQVCDVEEILYCVSSFSDLQFTRLGVENEDAFASILEALPRTWPFGCGIEINNCTDRLLELVGKLPNLKLLRLQWMHLLTDQGLDRFADQMRGGNLAELYLHGDDIPGPILVRLLSHPTLTHVGIRQPDNPIALAGLLASPEGAHLRSLSFVYAAKSTEWWPSGYSAFSDALVINEGLVSLTMDYHRPATIPEANVRIRSGGPYQTPVQRRNQGWHKLWRSRLRSMASAAEGVIDEAVADTTATPIEAWFPDLCLRVEREAVRLQKLALLE